MVDDFRSAHTPAVAATFWPWLTELAEVSALVLSEYKAYVLLGSAWASVTRALPEHLDDAYLAGTEGLPQGPSFRYAPTLWEQPRMGRSEARPLPGLRLRP